MIRTSSYLALVVSALTVCAPAAFANEDLPWVLEPEEYTIYAEVLDGWYAGSDATPVIKDHTVFYTSNDTVARELRHVQQELPALQQSAVNDFIAKNLRPYPLAAFINQRSRYRLLPESEFISLFQHGEEGWGRFNARYPDSDGVLSLSRTGFNIARTQALVCIANHWNRLTASCLYLLLEKQADSSWMITKSIRIWNSWSLEPHAE